MHPLCTPISIAAAAAFAVAINAGLNRDCAASALDIVLEVRGNGDAPGSGNEARLDAIANARDRLLIEHLEFWGDSSQLGSLAPILHRGASYFRNVRVVAHEHEADVTHVEITAELLVSQLKRDIGRFIPPTLDRKPSAIVIVQDDFGEERVRAMETPGIAETRVRKLLRDMGFDVAAPDKLREILPPEKLTACVGGADAVAAAAARSLFADVAVIGRATASVAEDDRATNLFRNRGSVALRIVRAADDSIAEELHATGVVESRDPADGETLAVEDACEKLNDALVSGIIMAVLFAPDDRAVKLSLLGEPTGRTPESVIEWLVFQEGIDAVEIVSKEKGVVRLRLEYTGVIGDLVERLEQEASLHITRVIDRDITAEFWNGGEQP